MGTLKLSLCTALIITLSITTVYARVQFQAEQTSREAKAHHIATQNAAQDMNNISRTPAYSVLNLTNNKR